MVGKKSGKALQREEGLERTDNGMKQTSWPEASMINQKNYYTEYMKKDDQKLSYRIQVETRQDENLQEMAQDARDKDRAGVPRDLLDDAVEDTVGSGFDPSKIIVFHPGSQNLRVGFASDALPKTITMVVASLYPTNESENGKRVMPERKTVDPPAALDQLFGDQFAKNFAKQCNDLKIDMRANKRKVLPNSKDLVIKYNRSVQPEKIEEHNDPARIEWTPHDTYADGYIVGSPALRVMDESKPMFRCFWPLRDGSFNERDMDIPSRQSLLQSIDDVFSGTLKHDLGFKTKEDGMAYNALSKSRVVFVIPDLYEKVYVEEMLELFMKEYEVDRICFIQESLAASFGAGYATACIVDVGAQKTSISCLEDGMIIEDSRINLKYGGFDVTETFIRMMLVDGFPYKSINLFRRYDFLLAEELKTNFCTMNQADISVQTYNFHVRAPNQATQKYGLKTYDEVILAPMGFYNPDIFSTFHKLDGRHRLIKRSYNPYDPNQPDDPVSSAQDAILARIKPSIAITTTSQPTDADNTSTPAKERPNPFNHLARFDSDAMNGTPGTSTAGSPAPEGTSTPNHNGLNGLNGHGGGSPGRESPVPEHAPGQKTLDDLADERDSVVAIAPLDEAIMTSIMHASKGDPKKLRDLAGSITVVGGGAQTPGFGTFLEERLKKLRPDLADRILVGVSPREIDGRVVTWKGASVFGKMKTNDSWITKKEWEFHGARAVPMRVVWEYS